MFITILCCVPIVIGIKIFCRVGKERICPFSSMESCFPLYETL